MRRRGGGPGDGMGRADGGAVEETAPYVQVDPRVAGADAAYAGQSAHAADKVINAILLAMGTVDDLKQEHRDVKKALRKAHKMTPVETQELTTRVEAIQRELEEERERIVTLNASLGTEQCRRLEAMRGNAYLRARVNARALRATIRHALQAHKFERRKLERAYRAQVMRA